MNRRKNIYGLVLFIGFVFSGSFFSFGQDNKLIASCCEGSEARCTGSAYCSACTNCSRCKHCNSGGSCGVCSGNYRRTQKRTYSNNNSQTYKRKYSTGSSSSNNSNFRNLNSITSHSSYSKNNIYYLPNDTFSKYYLKTLIVNTETLNLRSGPGTSYPVIEKLTKGQKLTFLAMTGNWVKVNVKSTKTIGFIHYKYILVVE
ncbi:SH3 domain-containing protein [Sinomicrobium sp. M5D2P17]